MYADVIVDISNENLDKPYQYMIPANLAEEIHIGTPVIIPFGNGNRTTKGYVIGKSQQAKWDPLKTKEILDIDRKSNNIEARLIELAGWIKEQFGSSMNEALKCVIPVKNKVREVVVRTIVRKTEAEQLAEKLAVARKKGYVAKARLYEELLSQSSIDYELTVKKLGITASVIKRAEEEGIITIESRNSYRMPSFGEKKNIAAKVLNPVQQGIADSIIKDISEHRRKDYLIHGITGSGKTEVYMEVIQAVVASGKKVIMLIPEIALTYQTVKRFYNRFGDRISIMNSKLSYGERYDQYLRAKRGETDIVIGPRSALFTPFENLGLIIIDEEHEPSYVSESAPRYSTREVAFHRAQTEGASVILGSATPSLEAYSMAKAGRITLFEMNERAGNASEPSIIVTDMREELAAKNRTMFSRKLMEQMQETLERKEQIMLFLNRRGYSGFVSCRSCGHVIKCPHCDVSMTLHRNATMVCHYCGYSTPAVTNCPDCGSKYIGSFGVGTQKIEEQLNMYFPKARVLRMDADTTKQKNGYEEILSAFANEEADILVGTQMIVKGHDFPRVTLVGILLADLSLYSPDFRSAERTYQLLAQAAGRAGRGDHPGRVVIQTYNPEHYSIAAASTGNYKGFFEEEYAFRKMMSYPPAASLLSVLSVSPDEKRAMAGADFVRKLIPGDFYVIGPAAAPLAKANDLFRFIIYIKSDDRFKLVRLTDEIEKHLPEGDPGFNIQFSFN